MKILLLGAAGNLGRAIAELISQQEEHTLIGWDKADIDVTDFGLVTKKITELAPEVIINVVAYNDVDECEQSDKGKELAEALNVEFVKNLANAALSLKAILVHYSSDYVFDGEQSSGYDETAEPRPISYYGETKQRGEEEIIALSGKGLSWYLIRTSKLFGPSGTSQYSKMNFFQLMNQLSEKRPALQAVNDEIGSFTYTKDLARATFDLLEEDSPFGIYHLVNAGSASWYDAADYFFKKLGKQIELTPVPGSTFPRPARRPHYSILLNTKRPTLRSWQEAVDDYITSEQF